MHVTASQNCFFNWRVPEHHAVGFSSSVGHIAPSVVAVEPITIKVRLISRFGIGSRHPFTDK